MTATEKDFAGPDDFVRHSVRRFAEKEIPGFGWVRAQSLTEFEIGEWELDDRGEDGNRTEDGMKLMKAGLIVRMLVNGEGQRRFHNSQREIVAGADYPVVNAVFEFCREHAGIPRRDVDAIAALRAIQKNSETGPA